MAAGFQTPTMAHQFRVVHLRGGDNFTNNVDRADIDFAEKKLVVIVRQTVVPETFRSIRDVAESSLLPSVEVLGGSGEPIFTINFFGTKATAHQLSFAYSDASTSCHRLEWSFGSYQVWVKKDVPEIEPDPDFPTPQQALAALTSKTKKKRKG